MQVDLGHDVRLSERLVGGGLVADLPVEDLVRGLIGLVIPDQRGAGVLRLEWVDDGRKLLVLDDDLGTRILGDVGIVRHHGSDLLPLEPDLVGGEHRLGVVGQGGHPRQIAGRHGFAGQDHADAGNLPRCRGVDGLDARVGNRAAQDLHVEHAGQHDVVHVAALAADETVVLDAAAACAHSADLDFVQCHRHLLVLLGAHLLGSPQDCLDDVLVAGAAAEVAGQCPANLVLRRVGVPLEQGLGRHHHAGRAEAALESVLLLEALLDRMQLARGGQTLDRLDLVAIRLHREHRAALDGASVKQHRAGAAVGRVTAGVGTGQVEALAQQVGKQQPRLDISHPLRPVDIDRHATGGHIGRGSRGDLVIQARHDQAAFCSERATLVRMRVTKVLTMWRL